MNKRGFIKTAMVTSCARKNAQQQSLIEGICHEIKNPVAIIRLSTQSLPSSSFSDKIIHSSDKITKLLDTLNSAFIGDIEPKIQKIDLKELVFKSKKRTSRWLKVHRNKRRKIYILR